MTTFKDMPPGERDAWLAFAHGQPKGAQSQFRDGRLVGCIAQREGMVTTYAPPFASVTELTSWAGA